MAILNAGDTPNESEYSHGIGISPSEAKRAQLPNDSGDDPYSAYERLRFEHRANLEVNSLDAEYETDLDYYSQED